MKYVIFILFAFLSRAMQSQTKVGYYYDNNGNRYQRYFIGLRPANMDSTNAVADSTLNAFGQNGSETPQSIAEDKGISVYPNPTKDLVMVTITKAGIKQSKKAVMYLIDNNGRMIDTRNYSGAEISFDLSKSPPGNYYLKIVFDTKETLTYNVVKVN